MAKIAPIVLFVRTMLGILDKPEEERTPEESKMLDSAKESLKDNPDLAALSEGGEEEEEGDASPPSSESYALEEPSPGDDASQAPEAVESEPEGSPEGVTSAEPISDEELEAILNGEEPEAVKEDEEEEEEEEELDEEGKPKKKASLLSALESLLSTL